MSTANLQLPNDKKITRLPVHIAVFVPSTKNVSQGITPKQMNMRIKSTVRFLNSKFGGSTMVKGTGSFTTDQGRIVDEKIVRVETYTTVRDYRASKKALIAWLKNKKRVWGQESIGFEFEEDFHFVS